MSPTRRDLFRRTAATVAAASIAVVPTLPVAAQPGRLASVVDCTNPMPNAHFGGPVFCLWRDWSPAERLHFINVLDREVPDLAAMIYEYSDPVLGHQEGTI